MNNFAKLRETRELGLPTLEAVESLIQIIKKQIDKYSTKNTKSIGY